MKGYLLLSFARCYGSKIHGHLSSLLPNVLSQRQHFNTLMKLNGTSLYDASVWADKVKRTKKYSFTSKLHYTNINTCSVESLNTTGNSVIGAIHELTTGEGGRFKNLSEKEKLMFLIHFIGDISQPLHVYGAGRGGNDIKVIRNKNGRNKKTNLHSLWDSEIPQTFISSNTYSPSIKNTSLLDVVNFNLNVSCQKIYDFTDDYILFEDYYDPEIVKRMFDNYINLSIKYL
jgi:hypothetical protein